jgi:hypothetical protein
MVREQFNPSYKVLCMLHWNHISKLGFNVGVFSNLEIKVKAEKYFVFIFLKLRDPIRIFVGDCMVLDSIKIMIKEQKLSTY